MIADGDFPVAKELSNAMTSWSCENYLKNGKDSFKYFDFKEKYKAVPPRIINLAIDILLKEGGLIESQGGRIKSYKLSETSIKKFSVLPEPPKPKMISKPVNIQQIPAKLVIQAKSKPVPKNPTQNKENAKTNQILNNHTKVTTKEETKKDALFKKRPLTDSSLININKPLKPSFTKKPPSLNTAPILPSFQPVVQATNPETVSMEEEIDQVEQEEEAEEEDSAMDVCEAASWRVDEINCVSTLPEGNKDTMDRAMIEKYFRFSSMVFEEYRDKVEWSLDEMRADGAKLGFKGFEIERFIKALTDDNKIMIHEDMVFMI